MEAGKRRVFMSLARSELQGPSQSDAVRRSHAVKRLYWKSQRLRDVDWWVFYERYSRLGRCGVPACFVLGVAFLKKNHIIVASFHFVFSRRRFVLSLRGRFFFGRRMRVKCKLINLKPRIAMKKKNSHEFIRARSEKWQAVITDKQHRRFFTAGGTWCVFGSFPSGGARIKRRLTTNRKPRAMLTCRRTCKACFSI